MTLMPGTGKTTVARRMGDLFHQLGLLGSAEVVEVPASEFTPGRGVIENKHSTDAESPPRRPRVYKYMSMHPKRKSCGHVRYRFECLLSMTLLPGFVGQSAGKTREIFQRARGKVLFVDEAYRLNPRRGGSYMSEVLDEIVQILTEPEFKNKLLLIFAGYDEDMEALLAVNAGLKSRVPGRLYFKPFDVADSMAILKRRLAPKLKLAPCADDAALAAMAARLIAAPGWANGRDIDTWAKAVVREVARDPEGKRTATATAALLEAALSPLIASKQRGAGAQKQQKELPLPRELSFADAGPRTTAPPTLQTAVAPPVMAEEEALVQEMQRAEGDDGDEVFAALQRALVELCRVCNYALLGTVQIEHFKPLTDRCRSLYAQD